MSKRRLLRGSYQNIIDIYDETSIATKYQGSHWYEIANSMANIIGYNILTTHFDVSDWETAGIIGAGVISALSPQTAWDRNVENASTFSHTLDKPTFCTEREFSKAVQIVESFKNGELSIDKVLEILGPQAWKTKPFFMNILNPQGDYGPTIDRHAIAVYLKAVPSPIQLGRGTRAEGNIQKQRSYLMASKKLDKHYNEVQATTWLAWRARHDRGEE